MSRPAEAEPFTCGTCEGLSRQRGAPPGTAHADCKRCGDPTKQYIGAVIAGVIVVTTPGLYAHLRDYGECSADAPGVRRINVGGRADAELYSAGWL